MKWQNKGHEYDSIASEICDERTKYYIWGAGVLGESFYKDFERKIKILAFIDRNINKQGRKLGNVYILAPEEVELQEDEKIIIATGWVKQVADSLKLKGYQKNKHYYLLDEFSTIYMMYKYNKLHVEKIDMFCNTRCTLRCKHCSALIPYNRNGRNYTFEEMKQNIDMLFEWIDYIHILSFSGGDAMVNPNLINIIEYVGNKYRGKQVQDFELYTNAIILPDEKMIDIWKKYDVIVRFTNYTKNVPHRQKIEQMIQMLEKNELRYDYVQFEKWLDMGYPQPSNGLVSEEELIEHCKQCSPVISTCLNNGKIFYCSPSCGADASGLFEHEESDGFDLHEYAEIRKKEFMEFYTGYSEKGYPSYCKRCYGFFNNNNRLIEVAEQMEIG